MSRPIRVLLDARMLIGRFSGVCRFVTALVDELARATDIQVIALCGTECPSMWTGRQDIQVLKTDFARPDRTPYRRHRWEQKRLPDLIRQSRADVYHATWNSGIPGRCPAPAVLTIHDLIPWHDPQGHFTSWLPRLCFRHATRSSVWRATFITTVSEYVRRDVIDTLSAPPDRTLAIPNGVAIPENGDRTADRSTKHTWSGNVASSPEPYVLYVGGHEERKNVGGLLAALDEYWRRFGPTLSLHLTGTPESFSPSAAEAYRKLVRKDLVVFLGQPDDSRLAKEYASATMLITLSKAEGFGLPVLEAMARGCPVVAADRTSLPEVVGDAGLLVDPDDVSGVAKAIHRLATDFATCQQCIARGRGRARQFTWRTAADRYHELYLRVIRRPMSRSEVRRASPPSTCLSAHARA